MYIPKPLQITTNEIKRVLVVNSLYLIVTRAFCTCKATSAHERKPVFHLIASFNIHTYILTNNGLNLEQKLFSHNCGYREIHILQPLLTTLRQTAGPIGVTKPSSRNFDTTSHNTRQIGIYSSSH